jgi:hypothetical protein
MLYVTKPHFFQIAFLLLKSQSSTISNIYFKGVTIKTRDAREDGRQTGKIYFKTTGGGVADK